MKFWKMMLAAGLTAVMIMAGCGQEGAENGSEPAQTEESAGQTESSREDAETDGQDEKEEEQPEETAEKEEMWEDNFSVSTEAAAEFARQIKEAVAEEDLEKLADLTAFPVYVGLPDDGGSADTREDFIALGAEQIFTEELKAAVAAADEEELTPSMAGFVLSDETGRPNMIFSVREGKLAVVGINY